MIVLDNSVLSALTRLDLLDNLRELQPDVIISQQVLSEYGQLWRGKLPDWIGIEKISDDFPDNIPSGLSRTDYSCVLLAKKKKVPLASDDLPLRKLAQANNIEVTGSIGLIKAMYSIRSIPNKSQYFRILELLQEDIYLSDELLNWALDVE